MRVTMATVWDRTSEVIAGRRGILGSIAFATLWLPAVVQQAIGGALLGSAPMPRAAGGAGVMGLLAILVGVIGLWGKLALVAVASDPATRTGDAYRVATGRLPLLIGLVLLVGLGFVLLALPLMVVAAPLASYMASYGSTMVAPVGLIPPGQRAFASLYLIVLAVLLLWLVVRLLALNPVVLDERAGIGSFRRSFDITRGHFWRLLGVVVLFGIVIAVAGFAVQSVVGIVARLTVGPTHPALAAFVTAAFTAAISAIGNVVVLVFVTQFYLLRREAPVLP